MNKINTNAVLEAYERTGIRASQNLLYDPDSNCACALGVLLYDKHSDNMWNLVREYSEETRAAAELLELDYRYAKEFIAGFDDSYIHKKTTDGHSDGSEVWKACLREELTMYGVS